MCSISTPPHFFRRYSATSNTLTLTIPAGGLMNGIIYDYLRLEVAP